MRWYTLVYTAGCVLYELVCLRPAFYAENMATVVQLICSAAYPPIPKGKCSDGVRHLESLPTSAPWCLWPHQPLSSVHNPALPAVVAILFPSRRWSPHPCLTPAALPPDPRSTVAPLRPPIPPTRPHSNPMVGAAVNRPDVAAASRLSPVGPTGDRCSFGRLIMLAPHPPPCPTSTPTHCPALPPVRLLSHATPPHDTPPHDTSLRLP